MGVVMKQQPKFWRSPKPHIMSYLLSPLSVIWQAKTRANLKKTGYKAALPVICVGNITIGGAGKTPLSIQLAKIYQHHGLRPVFLSRGYGSRNQQPVQVDLQQHQVSDVGDEPLLLAHHAPCFVCLDRAAGAKAIEDWAGADVIIMDDGMQNPRLDKDFTVLVFDGAFGMGNGRIIPSGPMRESLNDGLKRSQAVMIIGEDHHGLVEKINNAPVFHGKIKANLDGCDLAKDYFSFAGLARPEKFKQTLLDNGFKLKDHINFADHHFYQNKELDKLMDLAKQRHAQLITTEKDMMRIAPHYHQHIQYLPIELEIEDSFIPLLPLLEKNHD